MVKRTQEGKNNEKTKIIKSLDGVRNRKTKKTIRREICGSVSPECCTSSWSSLWGILPPHCAPLTLPFLRDSHFLIPLSLSYSTLTFLFHFHFLLSAQRILTLFIFYSKYRFSYLCSWSYILKLTIILSYCSKGNKVSRHSCV